ncbi:zinc finger MYND domain-containing protein [Phanerochaete sordida]|uniref:Zinc finger MYND domain-containing protein n=1 Tax=Phanerochaete sordida TaxID=48140 RepID=A0A9P3GA84_9APHY|nr:zinc finger MYND domain-containing protein [Phanerochaete sordida]
MNLDTQGPLWEAPFYGHDAESTTIGPPVQWTQLFTSLHRHRELSDTTLRRELLLHLGAAEDETWNELWKHGFLKTVLIAASDVYFCAYSKEELLSPDRARRVEIMTYVRWLLFILFLCLRRIVAEDLGQDDTHRSETEIAINLIQSNFSGLWAALWDVRIPFLHPSTANEFDEITRFVGGSYSLYYCIYGCVFTTDTIIGMKNRRLSTDTSSPYIFYLVGWIWVCTNRHSLHMCALEALGSWPGLELSLVPELLAVGPMRHADLLMTLYRDLCDVEVRDQILCNTYRLLLVLLPLQPLAVEPMGYTRILAAYRRQRCFGTPDPAWRDRISRWHFIYVAVAVRGTEINPVDRISEAQLYATITALARWLVPAMEGLDAPWPTDRGVPSLAVTLTRIGRFLGTYAPQQHLAPLRRHTYNVWRTSIAQVDERRLLRGLPQWREPLAIWRRLGRLMPLDARDDSAHEGKERAWGVLERCGWRECDCHVLRPAHPLKLCKGCWVVAYCGDRCQMSDWEMGGHRRVCRRRDRRWKTDGGANRDHSSVSAGEEKTSNAM